MSFQGNLHDFSATEILQLLGSQQKSGCLLIDRDGTVVPITVIEGRVVSTRVAGMGEADPLLRFLIRVHRLSPDQVAALLAVQTNSDRDLEDLLVNGHYIEADELTGYVERLILDDLMTVVQWKSGTYSFDPNARPTHATLVNISMDGALIEALRRVDEHERFAALARDPYQIPSVHELPDQDNEFTEGEGDLFERIDGRRTLAEVVAAASLTDYEAYEALQRMVESGLVQLIGRRDPGSPAPAPLRPRPTVARQVVRAGFSLVRELVIGAAVMALVAGTVLGARIFAPRAAQSSPSDPFVAAQIRDVRFALELYRRDRGAYPPKLDALISDRWLAPEQLELDGYQFHYRAIPEQETYQLTLATRP